MATKVTRLMEQYWRALWADGRIQDRRQRGISPDGAGTTTAPRNWAARHYLLLFFVLAYLLSWALWPLVMLNPASSPLMPFGPLIAAVVVSLLAGGRKELWALLKQLTRWLLTVRRGDQTRRLTPAMSPASRLSATRTAFLIGSR
jgi:hypothetical protein